MSKRKFFIHVHVPKTAGKTFQSVLINNFPPPLYHAEYGIIPISFTSDQIKEAILKYPILQSIGSHNITLDLPLDMDEVDVYAISYVRDPVDRFISNYFYAREQKVTEWMDTKTKSLREIISNLCPRSLDPSQLNFLIKENVKDRLEQISGLLDSGKLLLFPMEQFDLSCILLETMFPEHFKDCSYKRLNKSKKTQGVTEEDRNLLRKAVSEEEIYLHKMAFDFIQKLSMRVFGSEELLKIKLKNFLSFSISKYSINWAKRHIGKF